MHQSEVPRGNRNTRPEAQGHDIKGHWDPRMVNSKEQSQVQGQKGALATVGDRPFVQKTTAVPVASSVEHPSLGVWTTSFTCKGESWGTHILTEASRPQSISQECLSLVLCSELAFCDQGAVYSKEPFCCIFDRLASSSAPGWHVCPLMCEFR